MCRHVFYMIEYCRNFISTHDIYASCNITYCQRKMWMFQSTLSVRIDNIGRRRRRRNTLARAQQQQQMNMMTLFQTKLIYHVCQRSMAGFIQQHKKHNKFSLTSFSHTHKMTARKKIDGFCGDLFLVWNEFVSI